MKLCKINVGGELHLAAKCGRGIIDLTAAGLNGPMNAVIEHGDIMLDVISSMCADERIPALEPSACEYADVCEPSKLVCIGLNYRAHAAETGEEQPDEPVIFSKFGDALTHHGAVVRLPETARRFDYEAELVVVIGKRAWNVPAGRARDYIFGYTCGNDLSARDAQFVSSQWLIGKTFPGFGPAGPWIVTKNEFDPKDGHAIYSEVNGLRMQTGDTAQMISSCEYIVSYASRFTPLNPGDLIFTGTPPGVMLGRPEGERVWLKPGDRVTVTVEGIGTLENVMG